MASHISGEASLKEQQSTSIEKNAPTTTQLQAVEPTPNGKSSATPSVVSSATTASTFKALAAVSYAERIRTSSPSIDQAVTANRPSANVDEVSSATGKSGTDAKSNNGKRTGKNKSSNSGSSARGAAQRSVAVSDSAMPAAVNQVTDGVDGKQGAASEAQNDEDQGWQEVTTKSKSHHNSKHDKKDGGSASGTGRHKQQGRKATVSGTVSDETAVHEKTAKGKNNSSGRKDKEKGDKESRQPQQSGEDTVPIEPTRRQQQQQKEKDGVSPKAMGMKSASWRSSPLAPQTTSPSNGLATSTPTAPPQDDEVRPPASSAQEVTNKPEAQSPHDTGAQHPSSVTASVDSKQETAIPSTPAVAAPIPTPSQPTPSAPAINVWQLRKEKMKSSSTKSSKTGGNTGGTSKTVFNSLTDATSPPLSANIGGKKAGATKSEPGQGKRAAAAPGASPAAPLPSSVNKNAAEKSYVKASSEAASAPIPTSRREPSTPMTTGPSAGSQSPATRIADDRLWPDIATLTSRNLGTTGKEGKKKEREDEEAARPATTTGKKGA